MLPRLSEVASCSQLWIGAGVLVAVFGGKRERHAVAEAAIALGVTSALTNIAIKRIIRRERPSSNVPRARRLEHLESTSFPSGHAASAAAFSAS